jgi:MFS transporter, ACS family, hexuronate transporter
MIDQNRMPFFAVGAAFVAVIIAYLDRSVLAYAILPIEKEFGFSNAGFGLILAAFGLGFTLMVITGGVLVDHFGARKIWSLAAVGWSVVCLLMGFAVGFWSLLIFRVLLGVTESPAFPAFLRVVLDWFPLRQRARASAVGSSAVAFSSVVGAPVSAYLILTIGWRGTFWVLGTVGILWAIFWYWLYRDKTRLESSSSSATQRQASPETWRFILFNPTILSNNVAFFVFGYTQFFALTWLPGYLEQTYGMALKQIGWFMTLPWMVATLFLLWGGVLSDQLWKKTHSLRVSRSFLIGLGQTLSAACFIPVILWHSVPIALIFMSLAIGFNNLPASAFAVVNADLVPTRVATSSGLMNFCFGLAGILSPFLTGLLSTWTGSFKAPIVLMIVLILTSVMGILFFHHPEKKDGQIRNEKL